VGMLKLYDMGTKYESCSIADRTGSLHFLLTFLNKK
jgi:hypothetical protein